MLEGYVDGHPVRARVELDHDRLIVRRHCLRFDFVEDTGAEHRVSAEHEGHFRAPMPGHVLDVRVKVGQKVEVTAASGLTVAGTVRAIAPTADPQTRNVLVFVDLPRHAELKAGTFAKGSFDLGQSEALTVPSQSIVVRDGSNYVFVIDAQNKANQRKVRTGRRVDERVEVLEGLQPDEAVALQGAGFLNEADLVKVVQ